ncbi:hypothetical protein [Streptomyces sp. SP18BB07]|uniref:hypothetical protein n=1 Tax=Streptomyces sp. SP18BB07 TaxID=3002522 RepID=UPI002E75B609|nr:hypothetical protein [Streptomyces sp. SP18BB07]MEE1763283.1 hypothetical protein [Streptomyces sp. SP18BB07]
MTRTAGEVLEATAARLAPDPDANPLLPLIASGAAGLGTLAVLGLEQRLVIAADLRSFRHLAERSAVEEPAAVPFFEMLAEGEAVAAGRHRNRRSGRGGGAGGVGHRAEQRENGRTHSVDLCRATKHSPRTPPFRVEA